MMASAPAEPHQSTDRKRVKVYELRNNDWFDRGTGFCSVACAGDENEKSPRVIVEAEDQPEKRLLETMISKEDGFQKQQETLIVWTEQKDGVDMALSFQEAEGCAAIWKFVNEVQRSYQPKSLLQAPDDSLDDDLVMDMSSTTIQLPPAELGNLPDLESSMRVMSQSVGGREALAKAIMSEDYIGKLIPLVEMAEDLESLQDLHRLCNIMKVILLLNDTGIIEHAVSDDCVLGVVGALEYDPDFPQHKANHRQWLDKQGRYKEVVRIEDDQVRRKIHQTYRLQYLKDVVLARILDDPTFSVLNSLIFFNQVDIVQHLQSNGGFLRDLFTIFNPEAKAEQLRKKEAVLFIQQCCAIAKNLQPPARQTLYSNFLNHGLLMVVGFGLRNLDVSVRVGAIDILVSMIDHDPQMIRHTIYRQIADKQAPLTDALIELLIVEVDLGIKSQISDALKVILDPHPPGQTQQETIMMKVNGEFQPRPRPLQMDPQQELFLGHFYEHSAVKLFRPLLQLEGQTDLKFSVQNDGVFSYLNEVLCFYIRQHGTRSKYFVLQHNIAQRFIQLLSCKQKHLQLVAIRFFRHLVNTGDEFFIQHIAEKQVLGPILDVLLRTLPRDNLLSSACLDLFEFIKNADNKDLIKHLVDNYREKITALLYLPVFKGIMKQYEDNRGFGANMESYFAESEDDIARRPTHMNGRMMEQLRVDPVEEEYWNTSDDEDEAQNKMIARPASANGATTPSKALVDYHSDEEADENGDIAMTSVTSEEEDKAKPEETKEEPTTPGSTDSAMSGPPERLSEKRRREEEDDDEMGKLMHNKRRNSSSMGQNASGAAAALRRKRTLVGSPNSSTTGPRKIDIRISPALKSTAGQGSTEQDDTP